MESQQDLQGDFGGEVDEEIVDQSSAEPNAEGPQTEDRARPKPIKEKDKMNHLIRDKYRALGEANEYRQRMQELAAENARLQEAAQMSVQHSMMQFDANAATALELARKNLKEAEESGDVDSKLKAHEDLVRTIAMHERSHQWRAEDQARMQREQEREQAQQYVEPESLETRTLPYRQAFYDHHKEWIEPGSPHFNAPLYDEVQRYTARENQRLIDMGMEDLICSPQYFQELEAKLPRIQAFINRRKQGAAPTPAPRPAHPQVASARGSTRTEGRRSGLPPLNQDQRDIIRAMEITEEAYRAAQKEVAAQGGFETQRIRHQYKRGFM
jgi:hypothetical protein